MIDAQSLRINNLVLFSPQGKKADPPSTVRVKGIVGNNISTEFKGLPLVLKADSESISGVSLSPELLITIGFAKLQESRAMYNIFIDDLEISVSLEFFFAYIDTHWGQAPIKKPIFKYLHTLQNLIFALTGKELEINL